VNFLSKYTLYDWQGLNVSVFKHINHLYSSPAYDSLMLFLAHTFDVKNFPYFLAGLGAYALLAIVIRRLRRDQNTGFYLASWIGVLTVLVVGYLAMGLTVKTIKSEFSYPRPYVVLGADEVHVIEGAKEPGKDNMSFPSGHAAFATLLVAALWPILSADLELIGAGMVFMVCWSRMAAGVHFPADVIGGVLVALLVVEIVRYFVYSVLRSLFSMRF